MRYFRSNASPAAGSSRMSMPAKCSPRERVSSATRARTGASLRQGTHHDPQKLSTTVWPCQLAMFRCCPVSVVPVMPGAGGRCATGMTWPTTGRPAPRAPARWARPAPSRPMTVAAIAPERMSRGRRVTSYLLLLGVGESASDQVVGVDQDLVGELVGRVVRAEGQLRPDAGAGEPRQQDLLPAAARRQVGHRRHAAGVGLVREELAAADADRVSRAAAERGVAG